MLLACRYGIIPFTNNSPHKNFTGGLHHEWVNIHDDFEGGRGDDENYVFVIY